MPRPCQNGRRTTAISGHPRTSRTAFHLGARRLIRCLKRPSKQRVVQLAYRATHGHSAKANP
jgi:hypothetical protein